MTAAAGHHPRFERHPCPLCGEYMYTRASLSRHYPACFDSYLGDAARTMAERHITNYTRY